jgi:hypothetical protein
VIAVEVRVQYNPSCVVDGEGSTASDADRTLIPGITSRLSSYLSSI